MGIDPDVQVELDEIRNTINFSNLYFNQKVAEIQENIVDNTTTINQLTDALNAAVARIDALENSEPTDPVDPPSWVPRFAGDTEPGKARFGAAVGGNSDPARHEAPSGAVMGLRRTFFAWRHIDSGYLMDIVEADHAAGRLPWVSVKTPDWAAVAAGQHDSEIDNLLVKLSSTGKTVWLTAWHEPENDLSGGKTAKAWRDMQLKFRERIDALGVTNVAFSGILMSWTYFPASGRNPEDWWIDNAWDFVGIDHYIEKENVRFMDVNSDEMWKLTHDFIESKGLPFALGEWGNRGTDADGVADIQRLYDLIISDPDFIGAAAFDSELNAPTGSWELKGDVLTRFHELLNDSRTITLN